MNKLAVLAITLFAIFPIIYPSFGNQLEIDNDIFIFVQTSCPSEFLTILLM